MNRRKLLALIGLAPLAPLAAKAAVDATVDAGPLVPMETGRWQGFTLEHSEDFAAQFDDGWQPMSTYTVIDDPDAIARYWLLTGKGSWVGGKPTLRSGRAPAK